MLWYVHGQTSQKKVNMQSKVEYCMRQDEYTASPSWNVGQQPADILSCLQTWCSPLEI